ncbi:MAG: membrane dipeptidase [Clostridia bacterium]|nr:membrane dipeptidase [Clostridia bacterium]
MFCDLHADTPTRLFTKAENIGVSLEAIRSLKEPFLQIFAIWQDPKHPDRSDAVLDAFLSCLSDFCLVTDVLPTSNSPYAMLAIEGGDMLRKDLSRLDFYFQKGVRFLTLVWNGENDLGGGHDTTLGLTAFGKAVLNRMQELGMVADLSHANEKTFFSVAEQGGRLFCSHSNARAICNHTRNLTDEQIRAVIQSDGIIGLNLYPPFVNGKTDGTLWDLLPHIEHICSLGGAKNLAIGSDLDGIDLFLKGGSNSSFFLELREILEKSGFSSQTVRDILGENFLNKFCNF